jgi:hypothetical protein
LPHQIGSFPLTSQTNHSNEFNTGVLFFRNSSWTRSFLESVWELRTTKDLHEQAAMKRILQNTGEMDSKNKHFLKIPQYKFNIYPPEHACREDDERPWTDGDWIIHFAVCCPLTLLIRKGRMDRFDGK